VKAEVQEIQEKIPVAMGIMSGQRNRPAPMNLIQAQVKAAQKQGMGVAFFYYESLWGLGNEPIQNRIAGLQELFPNPELRQRKLAPQGLSPSPTQTITPQQRVEPLVPPPPALPALQP
jgi:uncharacterized lipoprotein YddW (UPF0748 family)